VNAQVVAAIIAVSGVLIQVMVTYLISRQSASDQRTSIDRELGILAKLDPNTDEAKKLDEHIRANINALVSRDLDREVLVEGLVIFAVFWAVFLPFYGLDVWRRHGVPQGIRPVITGIYWGLIAPMVFTTWQLLKYYYHTLRRWITRGRTWWIKHKTARLERRLEWTKLQNLRILEAGINLVETASPFKERIIEAGGLEAWQVVESNAEDLRRAQGEFFEKWGEVDESLARPPLWWRFRRFIRRARRSIGGAKLTGVIVEWVRRLRSRDSPATSPDESSRP
jgi:hypothetical protein